MFCHELRTQIVCVHCSVQMCNFAILQKIRHLLGLQPSVQFNRITNSQMAKLVYRDNINLKHGSRKRLANELEVKMAAGDDAPALRDKKVKEVKTPNPLSKALTDYLLQVHWV